MFDWYVVCEVFQGEEKFAKAPFIDEVEDDCCITWIEGGRRVRLFWKV